LLSSNVNIVKIPHIEGLRTADIVEFASRHIDLKKYLPEYKTPRYQSRSWVCNLGKNIKIMCTIVATLIEGEFKDFVLEQMKNQEDGCKRKRNTQMAAIPEFVSMIKESEFLSSKLGPCN
jgi:hypothetical protein